MNILYDYQIFNLQKYGGISRYFYDLISRVVKNEHIRTSLFMGYHINEYGLENYKKDFFYFYGQQRIAIPRTVRITNLLNYCYFNLFSSKQDHTILHSTYYGNTLLKQNIIKIVTVYDMIHELFPSYFGLNDKTTQKKEFCFKNYQGFICISNSTKRDLLERYDIKENAIQVIYLANSLFIEPEIESTIDGPYILYVGQRDGYKNFRLLVEAFAQNKNLYTNFKLIAFGGRDFTRDELELQRRLGVVERIFHFTGNDKLLASMYKHASLFVYPSLYEGFGIPPLEAMHYGTPVVVSNTSSLPEVVQDAGIYFDPLSLDDLARKLESVLNDRQLQDDLIKAGYEQEKKFSWDRCALETVEFYKTFNK